MTSRHNSCARPAQRWERHSRSSTEQLPGYLQEVGSDALVRALLGHLLGEPGDLVGGLGDVLGALDEGALVAAAAADQARHLGHEQRHALRRRDDVVALHGTTRSLLLPARHCSAETLKEVKDGRTTCEHRRGFFKEQGRSLLTTFFWLFLNAQGKKLTSKLKKKL